MPPMTLSDAGRRETLQGVRGVSILYRVYEPDGPARGRVLIAHGLGEHGGRYGHVAARLTGAGFAVVVPDHRGHGESEGRRVQVTRFDDYLDDLHAVSTATTGLAPDGRTVLIGHSMGGLIAAAYALRHQRELRALVLSAPAALPPESVPKAQIAASKVLSRVAPGMGVLSVPFEKVSRDPAVVDAYVNDPLVHRRKIRARLGSEMLEAMIRVRDGLSTLNLPLLVMQGTHDALVDPRNGPRVHAAAASADKELKVYDGLYHEIFNEPERDRVLDDLLAWLEARVPAAAEPEAQTAR